MAINGQPGQRQCVLIIEENTLLVELYRSIFASLECGVIHAASMGDAVRLLDVSTPDLFIVDDRLPDGGGLAAMREIRSRSHCADTPAIATVLQTSRASDADLSIAGFASIVAKPLQVGAFTTLARHVMAGRPRAAPAHGVQ